MDIESGPSFLPKIFLKEYIVACPTCANSMYFVNAELLDPDYRECELRHYKAEITRARQLLHMYDKIAMAFGLFDVVVEEMKKLNNETQINGDDL